jgi:hypothetical protein
VSKDDCSEAVWNRESEGQGEWVWGIGGGGCTEVLGEVGALWCLRSGVCRAHRAWATGLSLCPGALVRLRTLGHLWAGISFW